ncbi:MAG: type II toxin-antitoxin system RelE/ParE family toxin [Geminicoccaceae bacterium]
MGVRIKARARSDLLNIRAWGEDHWGSERTREFLEGLIEAIEQLSDPPIGRARTAFSSDLRSFRYRGWSCSTFWRRTSPWSSR